MSIDLYALDKAELGQLMEAWGQPRFRVEQLFRWLYEKGASSFDEMTDIPEALRRELDSKATLGTLSVTSEQVSQDGTRKRLYALEDGQLIESVLMPYKDGRHTACISSQAGCAMGCVFCATGQMGFARHLKSVEIFEQAARFSRELKSRSKRLSNVVLMGMGEPFHNYDAVLHAIRRCMDDLGIGARHITVSTVGLVPQIRRFAEEGLQVTLAISLHAATDEERGRLLPVNRRWPIEDLVEACRYYVERTGRRVTFEWALIAGKNDSEQEAKRLADLLRGLRCHVNLIPLNPTEGYAEDPASLGSADHFVEVLESHGVPATVRVRRGLDIAAGCGQLKSEVTRQRRDT